MSILLQVIAIVAVPGAVILATWSVTNLKHASKKPCNGELKQLAHLDGTIAKFHRVMRQTESPKAVMHHVQH